MDMNNPNQKPTVSIIDTPNHGEVPIKQNKPNRLLIIFGVVFILLLIGMGTYILTVKNTQQFPKNHQATSSPSSSTSAFNQTFNIQDSVFAYITEDRINKNGTKMDYDKVMLLDGLNNSPIAVGYPKYSDTLSYSAALQKIAYINNPYNFSNTIKENGVYVYDIKTKHTEAVKGTLGNTGLTYVHWSPSGRYLITYEQGLALPGGDAVYSYPDGEKITISTSIDIFNSGWINNDELVVAKPTYQAAGDCTGEATASIDTIVLPSGAEKPLVTLNGSVSSSILTVNRGIIYYKTTPLYPDGCPGNTITYWRINSDGTNSKEVSQTDVPNENTPNIVKKAVLQAVVSHKIAEAANPANATPNGGYLPINIVPNSKDPNWVIFELKSLNYVNSPSNPICILNINDPQQTFKVIANGLSPSW